MRMIGYSASVEHVLCATGSASAWYVTLKYNSHLQCQWHTNSNLFVTYY